MWCEFLAFRQPAWLFCCYAMFQICCSWGVGLLVSGGGSLSLVLMVFSSGLPAGGDSVAPDGSPPVISV